MPGYAMIGLAALLATSSGVLIMLNGPEQYRFLDVPNARSSHLHPKPTGGGLSIVLVTTCSLLLLWVTGILPWEGFAAYFLLGIVLIAAISLLDDVHALSFQVRIVAQFIGAIVLVISGVYISDLTLPVVGSIHLGWLGIPFTCVLIVGLTNAYNFMDGIDGLAGLEAVIAGFFMMTLGQSVNAGFATAAGLLIGASAVGFLLFNWAPARIFMGDIGSTFLGFSFAFLTIALSLEHVHYFYLCLLALWVFLFDTTYTILWRIGRREDIFTAHRLHLYQKMVDHGYSHSAVSLIYGFLALAGIGLGMAWHSGLIASWLVLAVLIILASALIAMSKHQPATGVAN